MTNKIDYIENVKVSIITVCYNSENTIRRTIEHILNQTYQNIEYIIIDGNSKDSTVEIIKKYEPLFNGRLQWVSEHDDGIYDAMNKGIKLATGELIGISNSDDWLEKDAVENVVKVFDSTKRQIIYGYLATWKQNGCLKKISFINYENIKEENIPHPTCFISKTTYQKIGLYGVKYRLISDYEFLLKAFMDKDVHFYPLHKVIANFTEGGASTSIDCEKEINKLKKEYGIISKKEYYIRSLVVCAKKLLKNLSKI